MTRIHFILLVMASVGLGFGRAVAEDQREPHRHAFAKDVDAFHSALAPLWHAKPGKQRSADTCAQAAKLASLAGEIQNVDTRVLVASVDALAAQCKANPASIDSALSDVHGAFHRLMERVR